MGVADDESITVFLAHDVFSDLLLSHTFCRYSGVTELATTLIPSIHD